MEEENQFHVGRDGAVLESRRLWDLGVSQTWKLAGWLTLSESNPPHRVGEEEK